MRKITMRFGHVVFSAVFVCIAVMAGTSAAHAEPKAVIELFTSQGCSSCPPADKLMAEFARDPSIVAMSLPIDYWDYLGWKDTLALKGHGKRQQAYARVRGDREVYTPQVVVNGLTHVAGTDRTAIERAMAQTRRDAKSMLLPVTLTVAGETLTVDVPAAQDAQGQAEVWLCPIINTVSVAIERGENHGKTFTYSNVVRRWIKLGDWAGQAKTYNVTLKDFQSGGIDAVVVTVQSGAMHSPGAMLGAATASLR
jgi:hypothetical protein